MSSINEDSDSDSEKESYIKYIMHFIGQFHY